MGGVMSFSECVASFATAFEAEVAQNLLDANGIKSLVAADDAGGMLFPLTNDVKLLVMQEDVPRARQILEHPNRAE